MIYSCILQLLSELEKFSFGCDSWNLFHQAMQQCTNMHPNLGQRKKNFHVCLPTKKLHKSWFYQGKPTSYQGKKYHFGTTAWNKQINHIFDDSFCNLKTKWRKYYALTKFLNKKENIIWIRFSNIVYPMVSFYFTINHMNVHIELSARIKYKGVRNIGKNYGLMIANYFQLHTYAW